MSSIQLPPLDIRSSSHGGPVSKYSTSNKSGGIRSEKRISSPVKPPRTRDLLTTTSSKEYSYLEPNSNRNTPRHNACLDVLLGGNVEAFIELFGITSNGVTGQADTEEDLHILKSNLTQAELATRQNDYETTYMSLKRIADHFEKTEQLSRCRHFRQKAQRAAEDLENLDRLAAAHNALGLVEEKLQDIEMAVACFEDMYNTNIRNQADVKAACHNLVRTKTKLAEQREAEQDITAAFTLLKSSLEYSLKLETAEHSAMCYYRLGRICEILGDADSAIQHLESYMALSPTLSGRNLACMVLARCYERKGDLETVIVYLKKLVNSSREQKQKKLEMDTTAKLAKIYSKQGDDQQAIAWYTIAFECAREVNDIPRILELRVAVGMAKATALRGGYINNLTTNTTEAVTTMLKWSSCREGSLSGYGETKDTQKETEGGNDESL